ncbi:MAG TPA: DedA family protein [Patescibacteria group bacterium]
MEFEIFEKYSYFGLFLILLIEESGIPIPIPGDLFIAATAALPDSNYLFIVTTVTISTLVGSTILFSLSKNFGYKLLLKYGKRIKFTPEKIKRIQKWFEKYGMWAIVIGRLIPGLRTVTPFTAGLFNLTYKKFWVSTLLAALIWANVYYLIGRFFNQIIEVLN